MRTLSVALTVLLAAATLAAPGLTAAAAVDDTLVLMDSRSDVTSGVGLSRVRVHNGDQVVVRTHHRDLRRRAYGNYFRVWIDTTKDHPGPDYVITGGLSDGTDWATGRATRKWHTRIDPLDDIGTCNSAVEISWRLDFARIAVGRDCLGGYQGRVRVAIDVGDEDVTDWAPARKTFTPWITRG